MSKHWTDITETAMTARLSGQERDPDDESEPDEDKPPVPPDRRPVPPVKEPPGRPGRDRPDKRPPIEEPDPDRPRRLAWSRPGL